MQANPDPTPPATSSWALIAQATGHPRASTGQLGTPSPSAPGPEETVQGSRSEAFPAASPVPSVETTVKASAHTPTSRPPPVRPLVPGHPLPPGAVRNKLPFQRPLAPGLSVFLDLTFSVKHQTVSGFPVRTGVSGGQGGVSPYGGLEGEFTHPPKTGCHVCGSEAHGGGDGPGRACPLRVAIAKRRAGGALADGQWVCKGETGPLPGASS